MLNWLRILLPFVLVHPSLLSSLPLRMVVVPRASIGRTPFKEVFQGVLRRNDLIILLDIMPPSFFDKAPALDLIVPLLSFRIFEQVSVWSFRRITSCFSSFPLVSFSWRKSRSCLCSCHFPTKIKINATK